MLQFFPQHWVGEAILKSVKLGFKQILQKEINPNKLSKRLTKWNKITMLSISSTSSVLSFFIDLRAFCGDLRLTIFADGL